MTRLVLALLAILAVVALRHREPDRAVAPLRLKPGTVWTTPREAMGPLPRFEYVCGPYRDSDTEEPDLQPGDPYPASLLP